LKKERKIRLFLCSFSLKKEKKDEPEEQGEGRQQPRSKWECGVHKRGGSRKHRARGNRSRWRKRSKETKGGDSCDELQKFRMTLEKDNGFRRNERNARAK
jgi:hypothetical protein